MIVCDTSGLLAAFDKADPDYEAAAEAITSAPKPRVVSPYVLAELDHLLRRQIGHSAARQALARLTGNAYELASLTAGEVSQALAIDRMYADLGLGLADCSLVVLAAQYDTVDVLTFDERHFRAVSPIQGGAFRLLPLDS